MFKRITTILFFVFIFNNVAQCDNLQDLFLKQNVSIRFCVNNYDCNYYNRLIHTFPVEYDPQKAGILKIRTLNGEWQIETNLTPILSEKGILDAEVTFKLISGTENESAVAVELNFGNWTKQNYVLMPAALYNGNRLESRKIAYSPKLNDVRDIGPLKPIIISDVPRLNINEGPSFVQERSGGMALPCVGFHSPTEKDGVLIITGQQNAWGDYGMNVEESKNFSNGCISIVSPLVRQRYKYEIANNSVASTDKPANFKAGDEVKFKFRIRFFESPSIQTLFDQYLIARKDFCPVSTDVPLYPFSECLKTIETKFNKQNFVPEWGYYAIGMRENFLQDWQIGWTGGMISTYPLLFSVNTQTTGHVISNFDWLFPNGISPSGFFWDSGEKGNKWYGGDMRKPLSKNWHLIRKSGDALYYIIKQFDLMKQKHLPVKDTWEKGTSGVAGSFVKLWQKWGQFGNFVDSETGDVTVGGSTSGAIVPAALVLASNYFHNETYLEVAKASAQKMYDDYITKGITCGGPGDAMQNPDSESSYAMLESFTLLYENTRDKRWLKYSQEMAAQFSTWVMSYDYQYSDSCLFGKLKMKTTGAVFANTQNKHGSPGICTHSGLALLRLYRATDNPVYLELLKDITHSIPQFMSHSSRIIAGMSPGWINERVSTTDWFEGIGEIKPGSTWAETSMMLTSVELPSIYLDTELKKCYSFDHLQAEIVSVNENFVTLKVKNPTKIKSDFKLLVESKAMKAMGWKENKLLNAKTYSLKAGEAKILKVEFQ